jgi:hypothetical protein
VLLLILRFVSESLRSDIRWEFRIIDPEFLVQIVFILFTYIMLFFDEDYSVLNHEMTSWLHTLIEKFFSFLRVCPSGTVFM